MTLLYFGLFFIGLAYETAIASYTVKLRNDNQRLRQILAALIEDERVKEVSPFPDYRTRRLG